MKKDFDLIVHKLGKNVKQIKVYSLGDLHVGSPEFDEELFDIFIYNILNDPYAYVVLLGDLIDNGLKHSKTNAYEATMRPADQKRYLAMKLKPIANKILCGVPGNHEDRSSIESDDCPLYDVMCKLDIEDLYRPNMAFIKINLGYKNKDRQFSYTLGVSHGVSKNRTKQFGYGIDGMDIMITGHVHQPESSYPAKIVIDSQNEMIRVVDYDQIIIPSFLHYGGYALKKMYSPCGKKMPIITLSGEKKDWEITHKKLEKGIK